MTFFIPRRRIFDNLVRFKEGLKEQSQLISQDKRVYKGILNYQTGDLLFQPMLKKNSSDWREITFEVKTEAGGFFEAKNDHHEPLDGKAMAPIAWKVMFETVHALNEIIAAHKNEDKSPEQVVIGEIDREISSCRSMELVPGWVGAIDRYQAEMVLSSKKNGSYLIRNGDDFTEVIAQNLTKANNMDVEVFICTTLQLEEKINDILILMTDKGWTLYRDNPDLLDSEYVYHDTPEEVLASLGKKLRHPVSDRS